MSAPPVVPEHEQLKPPPIAVCPRCRRNTILCDLPTLMVPVDKYSNGLAYAEIWGEYTLRGSDVAFCNSSGCHWTGTFSDTRDAALDCYESRTGHFRCWLKNKP